MKRINVNTTPVLFPNSRWTHNTEIQIYKESLIIAINSYAHRFYVGTRRHLGFFPRKGNDGQFHGKKGYNRSVILLNKMRVATNKLELNCALSQVDKRSVLYKEHIKKTHNKLKKDAGFILEYNKSKEIPLLKRLSVSFFKNVSPRMIEVFNHRIKFPVLKPH